MSKMKPCIGTFANADNVGPMRNLLLEAGAIENEEAKKRWVNRLHADACEEAWLRNFHCDPRGPSASESRMV